MSAVSDFYKMEGNGMFDLALEYERKSETAGTDRLYTSEGADGFTGMTGEGSLPVKFCA